jgi:hypothetical protein
MAERRHPQQAGRVRGTASRLVAILAASTLGACALIDDALNPPPSEPIVMEPEPQPVVERALPPAPRPRPSRVARLPTPAERAPAPSLPPTQAQPEPLPEIKLVGLSRGDTSTLLGTPAEERDAAPAKIAKFAAGDCVVDVYFYLDVARNDFYALHYNVHDSNGAVAGEAAERCLQRIYSENRK